MSKITMTPLIRSAFLAVALLVCAGSAMAARAQAPSETSLVKALRHGGYVLLMRHASSPLAPPAAAMAEPDNPKPERQLDETGKATARAMGQALHALGLPVGRVLSSPTYRALQTARLAGLPTPTTFPELGDGGQSMQAAGEARGAWLRARVAEPPPPGANAIIITHLPNIAAAYPKESTGLADGEAMVFHPGAAGGFTGRIKIEDWPALAAGARK